MQEYLLSLYLVRSILEGVICIQLGSVDSFFDSGVSRSWEEVKGVHAGGGDL